MTIEQSGGDAARSAQAFTGCDVEQREALVLSGEPRLDPLPVDAMSEDLLKIIERMILVNSALKSRDKEMLTDLVSDQAADPSTDEVSAQVANLPEIVRTMLRHPELFARQTDVGIQLLGHGCLMPRERELVILRVGWLCGAPYEWGEHVYVAKSVGISSAEIERVTQGSSAPGWSECEQAMLKAAEELHANAMISDATWATLTKYLDDRQLIELPILVGQYQLVAYYQNSLKLRLHEGNAGLKAR